MTTLRWPLPADGRLSALLARCTFPPAGSSITCAVSGGADSLCLLVLAVEAECDVTAVHVDHGLRPGSESEADVVRSAAQRFGARFRAETVELTPGPNQEARARAARYGVLPLDVATGHTADDQAETLLLNLMRGAGRDGLAAMAPGPRHPILSLRRSETAQVCADLGLTPVDDPTNDDPVHLRNRVRHEVLPLLCELAGRDLVPVLVRQGELLRDEAELLDLLAAELDATDARALARAPAALARRSVRQWLWADRDHPPSAATVERVLAVARGDSAGTDVGRGRSVRRTAGRLRIETSSGGDDARAARFERGGSSR